uniref:Uncharacterized serine-rich protein C215.13-like n=1 Tax=Elaeis guineensis var. tenera TaxID=51953 RepID=A0A6J0PHX9_ELAGV|nr:uncharacterized serine-rich protein C215.13-like [Elaeis guineensis]
MGSTNSGSIQSSSSGDDYFDSRTKAISSLNLAPQPPPPPPSSSISLSPRLNTFPSTPPDPNPLPLSLDMAWSRSLPPSSLLEHSCTILDALTTTISSTSSSSSKTMAVAAPGRSPPSGSSSLNPSVQPPTQPARPTATPRGSKKRSRASRRAPTTVLATDKSNFRAMVQEFTGFPAAPFIPSPFSRPRFNPFHAATTASAYPFGPLAPKLRAPLFAPISYLSSSMAHGAAYFSRHSVANANTSETSTCSNTSSCSSTTTSSSNYQLPSSVLQHPNLLNMQSPDFTFLSSLQPQTPPYHNSSAMPAFEANPPLGPSDLAAGGLGSLISMEGLKPSRRSADGFLGWADGSASEDRDRSQFRSVIGHYDNLQQVSHHAEKGSESMTLARGSEGRVDPWILSPD